LSKICQAVQFAHGKGILHRDIKPENVMIGTHGEVYLVDWGLAVSLTEDKPFIALASRAKGVAGTPSYMAPEMATGKGEWLSKATDIYLLGAVLHEIVTGQPPHIGDDLQSVLFHAFTSMPHDYGESIPEELAAICHKAMAPKPEDRHESVEAFRQSVVAFLQHRHSLSMSAEATTHFAELCQVLEKPLPLSSTDQLDAYTLFGRCRFGFEEALRIWEDNEQASKGLQSVLKAMAAFEMEQGASHAASVLLAQLAEPDAALQQRLDELLAQKEEEEKEFEALKQFQHEHDLTVSQGARAIHVLIIGILWSASFVLLGTLEALGLYQVQHLHYILADVVFCLFAIGFGYTKRGIFFSNVANRRLAGSFLLAVFSLVIFGVISLLLELTVPEAFALVLVMLFLVLMMLAVTIDFKMMGPASVYLLAAFVAAVQPRFIFFIHAGASLASFLWLAKIWSPSMCSDEGIYLKLQGQIKQTFEAKLEALQQAHRAARKSRQTQ
jgi:serine/threonine-protein kinase